MKIYRPSIGSLEPSHDILGMLLDPAPYDHEFVRRQAVALGCDGILDQLEQQLREPES